VLDNLLTPFAAVRNLVDGGGPFVFLIFLNGVVMWTLIIERFWYFKRLLPQETNDAIAKWNARSDHLSWCARQIREAMISRLRNSMSANLLLMRVLVPLAPLLGLIGTVSGMLEVFDSMALRGSADARTMATGVSHAMFCTMSGLAVSILGLLPNYYFTDQVRLRTELFADQLRF
jgi:biopolymer transport protein ExbB